MKGIREFFCIRQKKRNVLFYAQKNKSKKVKKALTEESMRAIIYKLSDRDCVG